MKRTESAATTVEQSQNTASNTKSMLDFMQTLYKACINIKFNENFNILPCGAADGLEKFFFCFL